MIKVQSLVLFGFLFLWSVSLFGQDISPQKQVKIPTGEAEFKQVLDLYDLYFRSSEKGFQEIQREDSLFVPFNRLPSEFQRDRTYWVRIPLDYQGKRDQDWILYLGYVSEAEAFIQYSDGSVKRQEAGFFVSNRKLDPNEGPIPKFRLNLKAGSKNILYLRFKNTLYPPQIQLLLQDQYSWQQEMNQTNLIQGIFQGLLCLILLYNFFLYLSIGDRTYLAFVAFVLSISIYFFNEYGYLEEYFLQDYPVISFHLANLVYLSAAFYLQFNRRFLEIPQDYPRWDQLMLVWIWISLIMTFVLSGLSVYDFEIYMPVRDTYHIAFAIALIIFIFAVLWMNNPIANFFVFGNFAIMLGIVFIILGNLNIIPFSLYYLLGGIVAQLFILTMALGYRYRYNMQEAQDSQQKLIEQLKENKNMQLRLNQELEKKVKERTREIAQQQEELATQNETLQIKSNELESAYKKMQDSVRYAQRLQGAILGDESEIISDFEDGFILNLPRDMVSGDFYWSSKIGHLRVLIAADCTGHGIPGALMTILGNSVLNDVVNEERICSPEEILYELDKKVVQTIQKQTLGKHPKDGMDAVVITYDEISHIVSFAGAKNPLYYVRDFEMHQIKGSSAPIGIYTAKKPKEFHLHEMQAREGDIFYLSSDGYQDQFGGEEGRKYLKKRFRALLLRYSHLPLAEQKKKFLEEFETWKGERPQTDDVLLIGIKI